MLPFATAANAAQLQANIAFVNSHTSQAWTFNLQANTTFNLTAQQELTVGANVKIVGLGNSVITPAAGIRAFKVDTGATVEFDNLTISGAKITVTDATTNPGGAALWVAGGSATLIGVNLTNNIVLGSTVAGAPTPQGGGILVTGASSNLTVSNSRIDDNQVLGAEADGHIDVPATMALGGGIFIGDGVINISDSTLSNNRAVGGNVFVLGSFAGVAGIAEGGGMSVHGATSVLLSRLTVDGNIAQGGSGINGDRTGGGLATGGAFYFSGTGPIKLVGSTVANNNAIGGNSHGSDLPPGGIALGGGLFIASGLAHNMPTTVLNSSIISNTALGGNGTSGGIASGGGIHVAPAGNLVLLNSTLGQNTAQGGNGTTEAQGLGVGGGLGLNFPVGGPFDFPGRVPQLFNNTIAFNRALNGTGRAFPGGGGGGIWSPKTEIGLNLIIESALNNLVQGNTTNEVAPDVMANGVPITVLPGGGPNIIGGPILQIAPTLRTIDALPVYPLLPNATLAIKTGTISVVAAIAAAEGTNMTRVTDEVGNFRTTGFQIDLGAVQFMRLVTVTVTIAPVATITRSSLPQSVAVSATVTSPDGTVNEGIVTFILFDTRFFPTGVGPVQANVRGGVTTPVSLTVPGNLPEGTYLILASYNDRANNFADALSTTTLTIDPWT
jgi:hypothetical protein